MGAGQGFKNGGCTSERTVGCVLHWRWATGPKKQSFPRHFIEFLSMSGIGGKTSRKLQKKRGDTFGHHCHWALVLMSHHIYKPDVYVISKVQLSGCGEDIGEEPTNVNLCTASIPLQWSSPWNLLHWHSHWLNKIKKKKVDESTASWQRQCLLLFSRPSSPHCNHQGSHKQEVNFTCNALFHVLHDPGGTWRHLNQYSNPDFRK